MFCFGANVQQASRDHGSYFHAHAPDYYSGRIPRQCSRRLVLRSVCDASAFAATAFAGYRTVRKQMLLPWELPHFTFVTEMLFLLSGTPRRRLAGRLVEKYINLPRGGAETVILSGGK